MRTQDHRANAVGMVHMALESWNQKNVVKLDDERKQPCQTYWSCFWRNSASSDDQHGTSTPDRVPNNANLSTPDPLIS